ncbi:DUF5686 and carboxypeptidase regulatory-like domain-containing protein [Peijinzhouia sedimentorum]
MRKALLILSLFFLTFSASFAQGIKGKVISSTGEVLPFASLYISELKTGTSSNEEGLYEISLKPGTYTIAVQYIGYAAVNKQVTVNNNWQEIDFTLQEQGFTLSEVVVKSGKEDAAYTIMRKAIAKAKYHLLQYDSFNVQVYLKGTGVIEGVPFFLKNTLKKEGVNVDDAFTSESVSVITFKQPNEIDEKVISIRTSGQGLDNASPTPYIVTSFYQDNIASAVSPLSTSAFAYYRFEYLGSFVENEMIINKIKVTPRSRGEQVFEGEIFIIEDLWAIHSLDLTSYYLGIQIDVKQTYAPVEPAVWMPINHQFEFSGKMLGFKGRYNYLASLSDYNVSLNEEIMATQTNIIDEKIEDVPDEIKKAAPSIIAQRDSEIANPEEMTRKQFRKMINEYEKEQIKQSEEPEVVSVRNYKTDSLATKRDSSYWETIRPVPLTSKEIKGYKRDDSVAVIRQVELTGVDTTGVIKRRKFNPTDIIFGGSYRLGPSLRLGIDNNITQVYYNTVEGFNTNIGTSLTYNFDSLRRRIEFKPLLRYGFSSKDFYGKAAFAYRKSARAGKPSFRLEVEGGKFVDQFNTVTMPIHPHINTMTSLLYRQNFMKIFEKSYGQIATSWQKGEHWSIKGKLEFAQRSELFNTSDISLYNRGERSYTENRPVNVGLANTGFETHNALTFQTEVAFRPIVKYRIVNGRRISDFSDSPELLFLYRKGINNVANSAVDFDHIELGINHGFRFGISGNLQFELKAGSFLNNNKTYFMDYKHFDGNRTILSSLRPAGGFRLLDYYNYSTDQNYFSGHTHYQFRKFLVTQLPGVRISGLRENIFVNYLKTDASPHYAELGYSIDNIFRLFRVEVAAGFNDWKYEEVGLRIGIATIISITSGDD